MAGKPRMLCHLILRFCLCVLLNIFLLFCMQCVCVIKARIMARLYSTAFCSTFTWGLYLHVANQASVYVKPLNLKWVLLQTVKTQMKCSIMLHFIMVYTVCLGKKIFRQKTKNTFLSYNLTPLDMYNGLFKVYCIKPEGRTQRVNIQCSSGQEVLTGKLLWSGLSSVQCL